MVGTIYGSQDRGLCTRTLYTNPRPLLHDLAFSQAGSKGAAKGDRAKSAPAPCPKTRRKESGNHLKALYILRVLEPVPTCSLVKYYAVVGNVVNRLSIINTF